MSLVWGVSTRVLLVSCLCLACVLLVCLSHRHEKLKSNNNKIQFMLTGIYLLLLVVNLWARRQENWDSIPNGSTDHLVQMYLPTSNLGRGGVQGVLHWVWSWQPISICSRRLIKYWIHIFTPPYTLIVLCLAKYRATFIFIFIMVSSVLKSVHINVSKQSTWARGCARLFAHVQ
jgi:hypothetical protein